MKSDPGFLLLNALVARSMVEGVTSDVAATMFSVPVCDIDRAYEATVLENFASADEVLLERSPGLIALVPSVAKGEVARTISLTARERQGALRESGSQCFSPTMFEVLYAYVMNAATKNEVSKSLFIGSNTVKTHIYRARRFVLPYLERYQGLGLSERAIVELETLRLRPSILLDREPPMGRLSDFKMNDVSEPLLPLEGAL